MKSTKKILIPTDFSVKSLRLVREAIEQTKEENLEIILIHGAYLPTSITDLLFFSKTKLINSLQTQEFIDACRLIKSKYQSNIHSLYVDIIFGNNRSYFHTYLEKNQISEIFIPLNYKMNFKHKHSFNPLPLFKKCPIKVTAIDWEYETINNDTKEVEKISDLFFSQYKEVLQQA